VAIRPSADKATEAERKFQTEYEVPQHLMEQSGKTPDKLDTTLSSVGPKSRQLDEFTDRVTQLDSKIRTLTASADDTAKNTARGLGEQRQ
jgi:hypothetical protein